MLVTDTDTELIRKGFEEDDLICDSCKDAIATRHSSHDEVCTDCFHEIYDGCP